MKVNADANHLKQTILLTALVLSLYGGRALAQDVPVDEATVEIPEKHYSPYVGRNIPDRVLWGDTRLHLADLVHAVSVTV